MTQYVGVEIHPFFKAAVRFAVEHTFYYKRVHHLASRITRIVDCGLHNSSTKKKDFTTICQDFPFTNIHLLSHFVPPNSYLPSYCFMLYDSIFFTYLSWNSYKILVPLNNSSTIKFNTSCIMFYHA